MLNSLLLVVSSFNDWLNDWVRFYVEKVRPHMHEDEIMLTEYKIRLIKETIKENNYSTSNIKKSARRSLDTFNCFISSLNEGITSHKKLEPEIEDLCSKISVLNSELASSEDDVFSQFELNDLDNKLSILIEAYDSKGSFDKAEEHLKSFINARNYFGPNMQSYFTHLRSSIASLKDSIKAEARVIYSNAFDRPLLQSPTKELQKLITNHPRESVTLVVASPETFIKKVQIMELENRQLTESRREKLFDGELKIAIERFSFDYGEYQQILWYKNENEARIAGKHEFVDVYL
jgi:hypothetical protein